MNIVHVIPLSRGIFKDSLTYFTAEDVAPGAIVSVPVRNRTVAALVTRREDVAAAKAALRASPYPMRKIERLAAREFFLPAFIESAREAADFFATTPGEVIQAFTPKAVLARASDPTLAISATAPSRRPESIRGGPGLAREKFILQLSSEERLSAYKSIIREEFAHRASVFFCLPSIEDIEGVYASLERGIQEYALALHGGLSGKELLARWRKALLEEHPVVIVGTPSFLSLPRRDLSTVIVDREHARGYRSFTRPALDVRTFVEFFAARAGLRLIMGDLLLRPETLRRHEAGEFEALAPLRWRAISPAEQVMVDMRGPKKDVLRHTFELISDPLRETIRATRERGERLFILVGRRGLAPLTACDDCGTLVSCKRCTTPLALHRASEDPARRSSTPAGTPAEVSVKEPPPRPTSAETGRAVKNRFLCHKCGETSSAERRCVHCESWRLTPLGGGIEKIGEEIRQEFPGVKIYAIESDSVTTRRRAVALRNQFYDSPGSILLGTTMALPYLAHPVESAAVVGIDSLFTIPDFRLNEKIMNVLLSIRQKSTKRFLLQTRNPDNPLFTFVLRGNLLDFYRAEIAERRDLGYPPFQLFIKVRWSGKRDNAKAGIEPLTRALSAGGFEHLSFPAFVQEERGIYRMNTLIKLNPRTWPDQSLLSILRTLPPSFFVSVDPEDIL